MLVCRRSIATESMALVILARLESWWSSQIYLCLACGQVHLLADWATFSYASRHAVLRLTGCCPTQNCMRALYACMWALGVKPSGACVKEADHKRKGRVFHFELSLVRFPPETSHLQMPKEIMFSAFLIVCPIYLAINSNPLINYPTKRRHNRYNLEGGGGGVFW